MFFLVKKEVSMCKIACVAGVRDPKKMGQFIAAMFGPMTKHDNHGFGYALADGDGLVGEKWVDVKDALRKRNRVTKRDADLFKVYGGRLEITEKYARVGGEIQATAALLHSRFATNARVIENTHPFFAEQTALVHNGVISNPQEWLDESTCDSEALLTRYLDEGVYDNHEKLSDALKPLNGYYACGVISKQSDGRQIMDIYKDDRAPLWICRVKGFGDVFCTDQAIVRYAARSLKWKIEATIPLSAWTHIRLDAVTGEVIHAREFTVSSVRQFAFGAAERAAFGVDRGSISNDAYDAYA